MIGHLPPIPEKGVERVMPRRRGGSIFEGASKYEILHYLNHARDRFSCNFDLEPLESDGIVHVDHHVLSRDHSHRVSGISSCSDSSCSSNEHAEFKRFPPIIDIERTDSGVGSESSKSSKASVELRRAASLSKSSDSGSNSSCTDDTQITIQGPSLVGVGEQNCQDCDLELPPSEEKLEADSCDM